MIDSCKKTYLQYASIIPGWDKMNKNDLINKYIEVENDPQLANAYLSAIILRYWNALNKYYFTSYRSTDVETCHEWLVSAILRALRHRKWKDPSNKLYNDPDGPDKVINRCIYSQRQGWFQSANTDKRRANFSAESVDKLVEALGDLAPLPTYEERGLDEGSIDINSLIETSFERGDYVMAFMVDGIVNYDSFERTKEDDGRSYLQFSEKKLLRHLNNLDDNFCSVFAFHFNKSIEEVKSAKDSCRTLTRNRMRSKVRKNLIKLRKLYSAEI